MGADGRAASGASPEARLLAWRLVVVGYLLGILVCVVVWLTGGSPVVPLVAVGLAAINIPLLRWVLLRGTSADRRAALGDPRFPSN